jgi:hypothetical protein
MTAFPQKKRQARAGVLVFGFGLERLVITRGAVGHAGFPRILHQGLET